MSGSTRDFLLVPVDIVYFCKILASCTRFEFLPKVG